MDRISVWNLRGLGNPRKYFWNFLFLIQNGRTLGTGGGGGGLGSIKKSFSVIGSTLTVARQSQSAKHSWRILNVRIYFFENMFFWVFVRS